jgi:Short C-terminal domain
MVGGAGYMAGKRRAQSQEAEQGQDERISSLEQQQPVPQQAAPQQVAAPQAAAPAGGGSIVDKLKELSELKASGALNDAEFERAKAQLLGGG